MSSHRFYCANAAKCSSFVKEESIDLIVTSPPYPMVSMWDDIFCELLDGLQRDFDTLPIFAYERIHSFLDVIWKECYRVLKPGGFACINIGDAVRSFDGEFRLFPNHQRIMQAFLKLGFVCLPPVLWHKPNNSPTKFMGSGMYPCGAYITYEHEYILIFRKGKRRVFKGEEKERRRRSAIFWEERNVWFSDLWDLTGCKQSSSLITSRERTASYPFEIPYRLVSMYSIQGDTVLDPFAGLGTTALACVALNRNSISVDIKQDMVDAFYKRLKKSCDFLKSCSQQRLLRHNEFVQDLPDVKKAKLYRNEYHDISVVSKQEVEIQLPFLDSINLNRDLIDCSYM